MTPKVTSFISVTCGKKSKAFKSFNVTFKEFYNNLQDLVDASLEDTQLYSQCWIEVEYEINAEINVIRLYLNDAFMLAHEHDLLKSGTLSSSNVEVDRNEVLDIAWLSHFKYNAPLLPARQRE